MRVSFRPPLLLTLCAVLLAGSACSGPEPLEIGYMAALSGRLSQLGVSSREALQIVADRWNSSGGINGRRIELVIVDDESDPAVGRRVIGELVDRRVAAIIGPLTSNMLPAVESIADAGVLVLSPTISTDALTGLDDHFIRIIPDSSEQGRVLALLMERDAAMSSAVVYDTSNAEYTTDVYSAFADYYTQAGGTITGTYTYDSRGNPGFEELSRRVIEDDPAGLVLICSAIDAAAIAQQLWKAESDIALYGSRWVKTDDILENGGRAVEGMKIVSGYFECANEAAQEFRRQFYDRLGYYPGFAPIYTYEAAMILFAALEEAEGGGIETLKQAIVASEHEGYCGTVHIDAFGDITRQDAYTIIKDGAFHASRLE